MHKLTFFCCLSLLSVGCQADIAFSGYASIVGGKTLDKGDIYVADAVGGGIYDNDFSLKPESLFALQANSELQEDISFTAQIVARGSQDYDIKIEQSYFTYKYDGNWTFYAGRRGLTLYKYSDFLEVGYAYNFSRPPISLYFAPISHYDGISVSYRNMVADMPYNISAYYGSSDGKAIYSSQVLDANVLIDSPHIYGITATLFGETWEARLGRHQGETNLSMNGNNIFPDDLDANYTSMAYSFDHKNMILNIEAAIYEDDGQFNDLTSYSVSAGYRFDNITPTLGYSRYDESASPANIPNSLRGPAIDYTVTSATIRYDIEPSIAVKFDVSRYEDSGVPFYGDATLLSVGLDLVF